MDKMEESQTTAGGNPAEGEKEEDEDNESRTIPVTLALLLCLGKCVSTFKPTSSRLHLRLCRAFLHLGISLVLFHFFLLHLYISFYYWIG
jgi:hypothetical protein